MSKAARIKSRHLRAVETPESAIGIPSPLDKGVTFEEMDRALTVRADATGAMLVECSLCVPDRHAPRHVVRRFAPGDRPNVVAFLMTAAQHSRVHINPERAGQIAAASMPSAVAL